ncbi:MAG: hypothetical protein MUC58_05625 [Rhizobiaceae bacterium]|jgi:hypothetical protein|nr:hypothetical protein [Rhizobiaceae bacterium]
MADILKSIVDGVVGGVLSEIKKKTGVRTTRRRKRVNRSDATIKKIEELLLGKSARKQARTTPAKKQQSRKATGRARSKVKRRS